MSTPESHLRPRTTPQIIDASFALARRHYWLFVALAGLMHLPVHAFRLIRVLGGAGTPPVLAGPEPLVGPAWWYLWNSLAVSAVIVAASQAYAHGTARAGEVFDLLRRRFWRVVAATALTTLVIELGLFLLVLPGVFAFARLVATVPLVADEGANPLRAMRRSFQLTRGNLGKVLLSAGVVAFACYMVDNTLPGMVGASRSAATAVVFDFLLDSAMYPLVGVVTTVLYYDLRIQREGYDIELMMEGMPGNGPG